MYTYGNVTRNELNGDIVDRIPEEVKPDLDRNTMTDAQRNKLIADIESRTKENNRWHKEWLRWKACTLTLTTAKKRMIQECEADGRIPVIFGANSIELSLIADYYKWVNDNDTFLDYEQWVKKVVLNG